MEKIVGLLAALATVSSLPLAIAAYPQTAQAQTRGMENRDERRDTRQDSRDVKQACKAGDEKTRSECRQVKHDVKQEGRHDSPSTTSSSSTTNTPSSSTTSTPH